MTPTELKALVEALRKQHNYHDSLEHRAASALEAMGAELEHSVKQETHSAAVRIAEKLSAERDSLRSAFDDRVRVIELQLKDNDALRSANEQLARDAGRYRWLKVQPELKISYSTPAWESLFHGYTGHGDLDAAIDTALASKPT